MIGLPLMAISMKFMGSCCGKQVLFDMKIVVSSSEAWLFRLAFVFYHQFFSYLLAIYANLVKIDLEI